MNQHSQIRQVYIWRLSIPLRRPFAHAAHQREEADPIVLGIELVDGTIGYGETLPRPYVTGESDESVLETIHDVMFDHLLEMHPASFADALLAIDALPMQDEEGRVVTAARAAMELALLDAYSRHFGRPISDAVGWLGLGGIGEPGSLRRVRYSGVIGGDDPRRVRRSMRKMRWFGLRDFKLKVGDEGDAQRVAAAAAALGGSTGRGKTLRLDANGGWTLDQAIERLKRWSSIEIACVEQPLAKDRHRDLPALKREVKVPIVADESLVLMSDAERLHADGVLDGLSIRISKNGGLLPAIRLAHFARKHALMIQLGCMVGETSILSAAGRRFLENVPGVTFAEGSYGRFLLRGDVVSKPLQFSCGGRPKPLPGPGWGIEVRRDLLDSFCPDGVITLPL